MEKLTEKAMEKPLAGRFWGSKYGHVDDFVDFTKMGSLGENIEKKNASKKDVEFV